MRVAGLSRRSSRTHPWRCPLPLLIAGCGFSVCGLALPPRSVNQPNCFRCGSRVHTTCTLQSRRPGDGAGCMRSGAPSAEARRANSIRCCSALAYWASLHAILLLAVGLRYEATSRARIAHLQAFRACPLYQVKRCVLSSPGRERWQCNPSACHSRCMARFRAGRFQSRHGAEISCSRYARFRGFRREVPISDKERSGCPRPLGRLAAGVGRR